MTARGHTGPTASHVAVAGLVTALLLLTIRSWRPGRSRRDRAEAVDASHDRSNSGLAVGPAPAAVGGCTAFPTSSFPDLVRLVLSLSGSAEQRGAVLGSLLSATAVTGAGGVPAPAAPVPPAVPVACSSAVPAPGALTPAGAACATALPGRCDRAQESSCLEKCRRQSSGLGLQRVGKFLGKWKLSRECFQEFSAPGNFRNFQKYSLFSQRWISINSLSYFCNIFINYV